MCESVFNVRLALFSRPANLSHELSNKYELTLRSSYSPITGIIANIRERLAVHVKRSVALMACDTYGDKIMRII
jgi:hypothetical protein